MEDVRRTRVVRETALVATRVDSAFAEKGTP